MSVEGPRSLKRAEKHLENVYEATVLRVGMKVLVFEEFASDSMKPMWMMKGDIGTVTSVEGDQALINFPGKDRGGRSLSTIIKKRNYDKLRVQAPDALPAKHAGSASAMTPRKILACGDVSGNLAKLVSTIEAQSQKVGPFDAALCVGAFFPVAGAETEAEDIASKALAAYCEGGQRLPVDIFFVDNSPALLQAAPSGVQLCKGLHFMGGYGVREVRGLRVAFLSGRYDAEIYDSAPLGVDFVGGAFTARAVSELRRLAAEAHNK